MNKEAFATPMSVQQYDCSVPSPRITDLPEHQVETPIVADRMLSFAEWKQLDNQRKEKGEGAPRSHGAFIEVIVKRGDTINYLSYGLPIGTNAKMLEQMMTGVLYPEDYFQGDMQTDKVAGGDLQLLARPGIHLDALDRFVHVPAHMVRSNEDFDKNTYSARTFFKEQQDREGELASQKERFLENLFAPKPQAKVADGTTLHHGAYEFTGQTAMGLDINGNPGFDLLKIASDDEHQEQMESLVKLFQNNENVTIVLGDKSKTVGECDQACADYFNWKKEMQELMGTQTSLADTNSKIKVKPDLEMAISLKLYGDMVRGKEKGVCQKHQKDRSECDCAADEMLAQAD